MLLACVHVRACVLCVHVRMHVYVCAKVGVCAHMYLHAHKHIKWVADQGNCNLGLEVITSNFMLVYCTNEAVCMCAYIYIYC